MLAGKYRLSFELAGDGTDKGPKVSVWLGRFGSVYKHRFIGSQKAKFEREIVEFELQKDNQCTLSFISEDAEGLVLVDDIKLERLAK